jgi:hypothetical protein
MAGFTDFESLVGKESPSKTALVYRVEELYEVLTTRYCEERYADFAFEKYGSDAMVPDKYYDFLGFANCLTESEALELYTWCQSSAQAWIDVVSERINSILVKNEHTLQKFADDMRLGFAVSLEASYDDSGMGTVADSLRLYWLDAAGAAIRENYSDKWAEATLLMKEMAYILANGAESELVLLKAASEHIDSLISVVDTTFTSGAGMSAAGEAILKTLSTEVINKVKSAQWISGTAMAAFKEVHAADAPAQPRLTTDEPDQVRTELLAAFDQLEDILKTDREAFGDSLRNAIEWHQTELAKTPSKLMPRPTVDEISWSE